MTTRNKRSEAQEVHAIHCFRVTELNGTKASKCVTKFARELRMFDLDENVMHRNDVNGHVTLPYFTHRRTSLKIYFNRLFLIFK